MKSLVLVTTESFFQTGSTVNATKSDACYTFCKMIQSDVYGKYRLLRRIAAGGMAEVMLARSSSIGGFEKILAIKRMHPRMSTHQGFVSLFIEEAKLWVTLNHPNIVQVFDFGKVDDNYYIAMELVDGHDLASITTRARQSGVALNAAASIYIMKCVFEGMAYAHHKRDHTGKPNGIIHRDISPHNILVSFEGQVKISDFGIAKALVELERLEKCEVVGKMAYISPEQARGEVITPGADIWSGGVVLYELLSNRRLFSQDTDQQTLHAVANQPIESLLSHNPHLPLALDTIVQHILARNTSNRASSAQEVAECLTDLLGAYFPRMNQFRLSEVISQMFDGQSTSILSDLDGSQAPRFAISQRPDATTPMTHSYPENGMLDTTGRPENHLSKRIEEAIDRLKITFAEAPNLWILVEIAELYAESKDTKKAMAGYELAAAKFMQRGLMVQAITLYVQLLQTVGPTPRVTAGIYRLPSLKGMSHAELSKALVTPEVRQDFADYLKLLEPEPDEGPEPEEIFDAPILSELGPEELKYFLSGLRLTPASASSTIAQEGNRSHSFFWIGRGRVVISTKDFEGKRVYLTSLSEGDCFGEHAFFSGTPLENSVEAIDDCWIIEAAKSVIDRLIAQFPPVLDTLRKFYKERVAESLIARSELLGSMSIRHRKRLADQFTFLDVSKDALLIREGDASNAFYAIKSGSVQVFSDKNGEPIVLAELYAGEIFGEIAALKGIARTASVKALERCEILMLKASDLREFLDQNEEIRSKVESQIETRADETARLLTGELGTPVLED